MSENYKEIGIPGGKAILFTNPPLGCNTQELFTKLYTETDWQQRYLNFSGKDVPEPRKTAWYSDHSYTYSGIRWDPNPMTPLLKDLAYNIGCLTGDTYNSVLINLYEHGQHSIGMHADDEPEFGLNPTIASLSLGAERHFDFQIKDKSLPVVRTLLPHGSVLVMSGRTQDLYKHGMAKTKDPVGPRINLTFRNIISLQL